MNTIQLTRCAVAVLAGALFLAAPVLAETVKGNGVMKTQARNVTGFTSVGLGIPARVEVRQGDTESVTVEADENLLPLIATDVKRGSLEIKPVNRRQHLESKAIRIVVQARKIEGLEVGGSGTITADALRAAGKLSLDIGGAGLIEVKQLSAERVDVAIGGSGDVRLAGTARRLEITIGGSGDITAQSLLTDEVEVDIAGSGDAQVAARKKLDVTIAGAGSVSYAGDPEVKQTIIGAGRVRRSGPLPQ
jgi:hypothetical protein